MKVARLTRFKDLTSFTGKVDKTLLNDLIMVVFGQSSPSTAVSQSAWLYSTSIPSFWIQSIRTHHSSFLIFNIMAFVVYKSHQTIRDNHICLNNLPRVVLLILTNHRSTVTRKHALNIWNFRVPFYSTSFAYVGCNNSYVWFLPFVTKKALY